MLETKKATLPNLCKGPPGRRGLYQSSLGISQAQPGIAQGSGELNMQGSSRGGVPVSFLERISARERSETEFPVGADDEDDNFERERKRFLLLDFAGDAGDDDDSSASGSSSDL
ncbi:hypothetical protein THAOC_27499, partial [Thalassiosira oceanica]